MKCPLQRYEEHAPDSFPSTDFFDCVKAECAWWDGVTERCVVLEVAVQLRSVNANLIRFSQNMTLR